MTESDDQTVYVSGGANGGSGDKLHMERDCPALRRANVVFEKDRLQVPNREECQRCFDSEDVCNPDNSSKDIYNAAVAAGKRGDD